MIEIEPRTSTRPEGRPHPCAGYDWFYLFYYIRGEEECLTMELVNELVNIVKEVGFPIACVVAMFWQMEKERAAHSAESAAWVDALNRNTNVIERLTDKLGG